MLAREHGCYRRPPAAPAAVPSRRREGVGVTQYADERAERIGAPTVSAGWPAVVVTDVTGRVVHWSESATTVYGWTADEAVGRTARELIVDPLDGDAAGSVVAGVRTGEAWEGAFRVRHRDGTTFVAHVRDTP